MESSLGYMVKAVGKAPSWKKRTSACKVLATTATRKGWSGGTWLGSLAEAREESLRHECHILQWRQAGPECWRVIENEEKYAQGTRLMDH